MRILLFTDVHWSAYTNIVRQAGEKYSKRLELLISSMNWVNELAVKEGCDCMICAGDFMDKPQLTDKEITALRGIKWNGLKCHFLVGNHESSVNSLDFRSVDAVADDSTRDIIGDYGNVIHDDENGVDILFIPYVTETDRKPLTEFIKGVDKSHKLVIISHNDLKDVQYGGFLSQVGFPMGEIEENCSLFLNGHIHNSEWVSKKVLNLGSLTAHNFTNDSFKYKYGAWVLDTKDLSMSFHENPYSLNFYKVDVVSEDSLKKLDGLKGNAVLSIKCTGNVKEALQEKLASLDNVLTYRIVYQSIQGDGAEETKDASQLLSKDHLAQFREYIIDTLGKSEVVLSELQEVCR